jgi:Ca-activated chloride channel family protein
MNRTVALFGAAAALALVALLVGQKPNVQTTVTPIPVPVPVTTATPVPPPTPPSSGALTLTARVSHPVIPVGTSDIFVTADVVGRNSADEARSLVDLALVIDRSGSMAGEKLAYAKQAAEALVAQLTEKDRLGIIDFGSDVRRFESETATGANKEEMISYIRRIRDDGGTNTYAALLAARAALQSIHGDAIRRVILISDGIPTEGVTDARAISSLAHNIHQQGISVSAIGVGADFNEDLMTSIAELGSGSYGYLRDTRELASLFRRDLMQASHIVARDVNLSFTLPSGVRLEEVLGRNATRSGQSVQVALPDISAGQLERVVMRVAVTGERSGEQVSIADVRANFVDSDDSKSAQAQVALASTVSANQEEVLSRRDKDAVLHAARAVSAQRMQEAARELAKGDRGGAMGLLEKAKEAFAPAEALAGPAAVAPDLAAQGKMMSAFGSSQSDDEIQDAVKTAKKAARSNFGSIGSTY